MANIYGRANISIKTNKSGGGVIAGDVVVPDGSNDSAFTTTTSASATSLVWIAQETIANNASGRVLTSGPCDLVNVNASVTRGHYGATFTVAKQATDAGTSRTTGTFCYFRTGGTTPKADIYSTDLLGSSLTNPMTTKGDIIIADTGGTPTRLAAGATSGMVLTSAGSAAFETFSLPGFMRLGQTVLGSANSTITFSSIPATFENLQLIIMGRGTVSALNAEVHLQFNTDSGANYHQQAIQEVGSTISGAVLTGQTSLAIGYIAGSTLTANYPGAVVVDIPAYARTVFFKLLHAESGGHSYLSGPTADYSFRMIGQWDGTAAIATITLTCSSGNFDTGTVATLYGLL